MEQTVRAMCSVVTRRKRTPTQPWTLPCSPLYRLAVELGLPLVLSAALYVWTLTERSLKVEDWWSPPSVVTSSVASASVIRWPDPTPAPPVERNSPISNITPSTSDKRLSFYIGNLCHIIYKFIELNTVFRWAFVIFQLSWVWTSCGCSTASIASTVKHGSRMWF